MALKDEYPELDQALTEFSYAVKSIKHSMVDGHLSPDEIVSAIPDQKIREGVQGQLTSLPIIFAEIGKLMKAGSFAMFRYVPEIMSRLAGMFG